MSGFVKKLRAEAERDITIESTVGVAESLPQTPAGYECIGVLPLWLQKAYVLCQLQLCDHQEKRYGIAEACQQLPITGEVEQFLRSEQAIQERLSSIWIFIMSEIKELFDINDLSSFDIVICRDWEVCVRRQGSQLLGSTSFSSEEPIDGSMPTSLIQ